MIDRQHQSLLARLRNHRVALGHRIGHRLFHEHVATHIERAQGQRAVTGRRREHVDGMRAAVGQFGQVRYHALDAEGLRQFAGGLSIEIADANDLHIVEPLQRLDVVTRDVAGTHDADAQALIDRSIHPGIRWSASVMSAVASEVATSRNTSSTRRSQV